MDTSNLATTTSRRVAPTGLAIVRRGGSPVTNLKALLDNSEPTTAAIIEDVEFMAENHCRADEIAARLFTTSTALIQRLRRAGRADLAAFIERTQTSVVTELEPVHPSDGKPHPKFLRTA